MNILMVRHGEIPSNVEKVYAGKSAERLTPKGVAQAEIVAGKLKDLHLRALYSSPIQRAIQTAEIIGKKSSKDVIVEDAFRELELGPWEGMSENDIAQKYPEEWAVWNSNPAELKLPGREMLHELMARILEGLKHIYQNAEKQNVVIVTHVAIIRVLLLWHENKSLNLYKTIHVPNAEIFKIEINGHLSL